MSTENDRPPEPPPIAGSTSLAAARPKRRWIIGLVIALGVVALLAVLGLSVLNVLAEAAAVFQPPKAGIEAYTEVVLRKGTVPDKIAEIRIEGIISRFSFDGSGRDMVQRVRDELKLAQHDPAVKAVLLKIDSPGGEVMATDNIHQAIQKFTAESGKPVIACLMGLAASGGYYIAAASEYIVAEEITLTGSIGVIMQTVNVYGLLEKFGAKPYTIASGVHKDTLSTFKAPAEIEKSGDVLLMQELIDFYFARFKKAVQDGRTEAAKFNADKDDACHPLQPGWETLADGRILTGAKAFEMGFVDKLGNYDEAIKIAEHLADIQGKARLVRYAAPFDLTGILRFFVRSEDKSVKVDLGIDLPRLDPGRPYYIWPWIYR